jgi:hypothetical protein
VMGLLTPRPVAAGEFWEVLRIPAARVLPLLTWLASDSYARQRLAPARIRNVPGRRIG